MKKRQMQFKLIIAAFFFPLLSAQAIGQPQKVTLESRNETLSNVFKSIEEQTNLFFFFNDSDVNAERKVSINEKDQPLERVLEKLLGNAYEWEIINNRIVVKSMPRTEQQQPAQPVKATVTGRVSDNTGEALPGTTVKIKGTTTGAVTNAEGSFSISVLPGQTLVFSFIGMKTQEVVFNGQKEIIVKLEEAVNEIEEVVVSTGIFNRPRESYTGAVTVVNSAEIARSGTGNLISRLSNLDPSFFVMENNIMGSDPNTLPDIQLRGSTSLTVGVRELQDASRDVPASNLPLFILDGFEVTLRQVMDLDPSLIESATLLKDASATALYGSRGSNGILVIEKKKPQPGQLRLSYKGDFNISAPDFTSYNLLNAPDKLQYEVAAGLFQAASVSGQTSLDNIYSIKRADVERGVNTYWLKYPVHVGVGQRHSLSVDGGDTNMIYSVNLSYQNTVGVMKESKRNTLSGNVFLQYTYKKFRVQNDLGVSSNKAFNSPFGNFSNYARLNPYWTPYDNEGKLKTMLTDYLVEGQLPGNPLYDATLPYRDDSGYDNYYNNFAVNWEPFFGASIRGRFRVSKNTGRNDRFISPRHSSFVGWTGEDYQRRGNYTYTTTSSINYDGDITANYTKAIAERHQLTTGLNFSFGQEKSESHTTIAEAYSPTNMVQLGLANAYEKDGRPSSGDSYSRRSGFLANVNYTYDNRYFADFSGNLEGSSRFGSNNKMAPFWSAGLGWNVHNESFMSQLPLISYLRLRASYGTSGSQNFNPYQARTTFQYYKGEDYQYWPGAYMIALGNPDLKWQTTKQFNGGFEFGLFNNFVKFNADFYNKTTSGVLMDVNIAPAGGFDSYKANLGEVENKGFELSGTVFLIRNSDKRIYWSVTASALHNTNRVLKISNALDVLNQAILDGTTSDDFRNPSFLVKEGESLNTIFAVKSLGIDPSTGQELFEKLDGKHTFNWHPNDQIPCGVTDPKLWGNINTLLRYKGFALNVAFAYRTGGNIYNSTLVDKVENVDPYYNVDQRVYNDRWKQSGDKARFKSVLLYSQRTYASTRFVMKEHTLDCRLINLSYEFDTEWLKNTLRMDYLSVGLFTENPFRFSSIKQERGTSYPFARTYSLSLSARF